MEFEADVVGGSVMQLQGGVLQIPELWQEQEGAAQLPGPDVDPMAVVVWLPGSK